MTASAALLRARIEKPGVVTIFANAARAAMPPSGSAASAS
jgi:hypothetical protein